ncbi:MAG: hypothetical protein ACI915_000145 [Gammaproteobacteria bacterium]|jgi:hypothetical protein
MRNRPIRDTLQRAIGALRLHSVGRTDRVALAELINSLRPIDAGFDLLRLGPEGDGGYLIPDDINGIEYAFSPGVSTESGFEASLVERGMQVFLADYSVDGPGQASDKFSFEKKYIGSFADPSHMTLDVWKTSTIGDYASDLLLQMDIEGAEFEALLNTSDSLLCQFRVLVIEFHYLHQLWNKPWFLIVKRVFEKLLANHSVVHIHPNNGSGSFKSRGLEIPRVAEFTFIRNDRIKQRQPATIFPHPLDRDNKRRKKTMVLPPCWYR